jgi:hypothetical protein
VCRLALRRSSRYNPCLGFSACRPFVCERLAVPPVT